MNHVGISVVDIDKALNWYHEVLGFAVLVAPEEVVVNNATPMGLLLSQMYPPEMKRVKMAHMASGNGVGLELFQFIEPPGQRPNVTDFEYTRTGFFHICVTDPEPEKLVSKIEATGGRRLSPVLTVFPGEIFQAVYTLDPFGNLVEIMATSYERQMSNRDRTVTSIGNSTTTIASTSTTTTASVSMTTRLDSTTTTTMTSKSGSSNLEKIASIISLMCLLVLDFSNYIL